MPVAGVAPGVLVNVFLQIDTVAGNQTSRVAVNRSADPATLLADLWMLTSRDGTAWAETRVSSASFDVSQARLAGVAGSSASHAARALSAQPSAAEETALRSAHGAATMQALEQRVPGWQQRAQVLSQGQSGQTR